MANLVKHLLECHLKHIYSLAQSRYDGIIFAPSQPCPRVESQESSIAICTCVAKTGVRMPCATNAACNSISVTIKSAHTPLCDVKMSHDRETPVSTGTRRGVRDTADMMCTCVRWYYNADHHRWIMTSYGIRLPYQFQVQKR